MFSGLWEETRAHGGNPCRHRENRHMHTDRPQPTGRFEPFDMLTTAPPDAQFSAMMTQWFYWWLFLTNQWAAVFSWPVLVAAQLTWKLDRGDTKKAQSITCKKLNAKLIELDWCDVGKAALWNKVWHTKWFVGQNDFFITGILCSCPRSDCNYFRKPFSISE